jgi:hypothetical protein
VPDPGSWVQSCHCILETACALLFLLGPSSPDSVLRPRPSSQVLDQKELMSQLRQASRGGICMGRAWAQQGTSSSFLPQGPGIP